jgi:hypothetical protein
MAVDKSFFMALADDDSATLAPPEAVADESPNIQAEEEPKTPEDWKSVRVPDAEEFYGRVRGKTLKDVDETLRQLEREKREAETFVNKYERELAAALAEVKVYRERFTPPKKEEPKEEEYEFTVDDLASDEGPKRFARKLREEIKRDLLPLVEAQVGKAKQEVTTDAANKSALEKARDAAAAAFKTMQVPEEDYAETWNDLISLAQQEQGGAFSSDNWINAAKKKREALAKRYGLKAEVAKVEEEVVEAPKPEAKPKVQSAPMGNFEPAKPHVVNGKTLKPISASDREVWASAGRNMGFEGPDLEDFIMTQASIRQGLMTLRKGIL